jgi:protein-S-isoprenylcysteine O-methyltransferase Ste14
MDRYISFLYGLACYVIFFFTMLYAVGFVSGLAVPKTVDTGATVPMVEASAVDLLLIGVFAIQHSVMARPAFKAWWTQFVPKPVERSTYVLLASLALVLLFWQWRPLPAVLWHVDQPQTAVAITGLSHLGWLIVLSSTFLINHFELFGLKQVYSNLRGEQPAEMTFRTPGLYKNLRHPIYFGFIVAFWATPMRATG